MMGTRQRDFRPLLPESISLEESWSRRTTSIVVWMRGSTSLSREGTGASFVYAKGGRPSVDPVVVFFRLQLVMFFEDIPARSASS
jgi:hypothetical protein